MSPAFAKGGGQLVQTLTELVCALITKVHSRIELVHTFIELER